MPQDAYSLLQLSCTTEVRYPDKKHIEHAYIKKVIPTLFEISNLTRCFVFFNFFKIILWVNQKLHFPILWSRKKSLCRVLQPGAERPRISPTTCFCMVCKLTMGFILGLSKWKAKYNFCHLCEIFLYLNFSVHKWSFAKDTSPPVFMMSIYIAFKVNM